MARKAPGAATASWRAPNLKESQQLPCYYQAEPAKLNSTVIAVFHVSISRFKDDVEEVVRSIWQCLSDG